MAAPIVAGVGGLVSAFGSNQAGQAAQDEANFNASIKKQQARITLDQAAEDERRLRVQAGKVIGGIKTSIGASGVKNEGSALDVLQESMANAELDALTTRHQGQLKAWALQVGAQGDEMAGRNARTASAFNTAGALLSGGASVISKF